MEEESVTILPGAKKISWSQYRLWRKCPHKHHLIYREGEERDPPSKHTDYGSALHNTAEDWFSLIQEGKTPDFDPRARFIQHFVSITRPNQEGKIYQGNGIFKKGEISEWAEIGKESIEELLAYVKANFPGWEIFSAEHDLMTPISDKYPEYWFNGFVDLILRRGDEFYILDYKTCSWGWGKDKIGDPYTMGQIQAYAYYFMRQHPDLVQNISQFKAAYLLVKKTAKSGARIELLGVPVRKQNVDEIQNGLDSMILALQEGRHPARGMTNGECTAYGGCRFMGTEKCPKTLASA